MALRTLQSRIHRTAKGVASACRQAARIGRYRWASAPTGSSRCECRREAGEHAYAEKHARREPDSDQIAWQRRLDLLEERTGVLERIVAGDTCDLKRRIDALDG